MLNRKRRNHEKEGRRYAEGFKKGIESSAKEFETTILKAIEAGIPIEVIMEIAAQVFGFEVEIKTDQREKEDHETG